MSDFDYSEYIKDVKKDVLDRFIDELEEIETPKEIYFHDIISEVVDEYIPYDNIELIQIIEESGNENDVEECLIDSSRGLQDGVLRPMAYESTKIALFEDTIFMDLQDKMNNETLTQKQAKEIIDQIQEYFRDEDYN